MKPSAAILSALLFVLIDPRPIVDARAEERASRQPSTRSPAAALTVDLGRPVHVMQGGLGASWHALGPTVYHYPDLVNRDNRTSRGSAFGGNPPLRPEADTAWQDVLRHARWLGLDFVRVEIDMRMYNPRRGEFTWDSEEMETLHRILDYCQSNHVDVFLTMMWQDVDWNAHPGVTRLQSAPRSTADFAESYAALIERLVKARGYSCIRWITFSNEPGFDGCWWLGPDRKPASITPALHAMRAALDRRGLQGVAVCGPDGHTLRMGQFDPREPAAGALSVHDYNATVSLAMYREGVSIARERGIPFFVSEFGHFFMGTFEGDKIAMGSPRSEAPKSYAAQLLNAEKILVGLNEGVRRLQPVELRQPRRPGRAVATGPHMEPDTLGLPPAGDAGARALLQPRHPDALHGQALHGAGDLQRRRGRGRHGAPQPRGTDHAAAAQQVGPAAGPVAPVPGPR